MMRLFGVFLLLNRINNVFKNAPNLKQKYSILRLLTLLMASCAAYAQGEANIWYFGNKAGLDFSGGNPVTLYDGQLNNIEGCTTLCDASGHLQFYTNGISVWNKYHVIMDNGTGLFGDPSSSQSAVIVQKPGSNSIFYIFTTNAFDNNGGFRYSVVDMTANGGNGSVISKNTLLSNSTCEKVAVIRHTNGQDVWVITHLWDNDAFSAQLITASGIGPAQVISHAGCMVPADDDRANAIGYLKISADGKKIVACHTYLGKAELYDFDAATGQVSNATGLCNTEHVYGAEFSPDNNVLYIGTVDERKLYQFDLTAANIADSKILVSTLPQSLGALQLAPNGKIYVAMAEIDKLSVINNPNHLGAGCSLSTNAIDLGGRMCMLGLPSYNQSVFYTKINAASLCAGNNTSFSFEAGFTPQSISWNFGDNLMTSQTAPSHHYAAAGNYTVTVTVTYAGGVIVRTKEIRISPAPTVANIVPQVFCLSGNENYFLSSNDVAVLHGQPASEFAVTYYATLSDAQNQTGALPDNYTLTAGSTTIYAVIKSLAPDGCSAIAHFVLTAYTQPVDSQPSDFHACDGLVRDGIAAFDLDTKTDEILHGQPESGYSVKYYTDTDDAENGVSPIAGDFYNTENSQIIYARITNAGGCYKVVSFRLVVDRCNDPDDADVFPKFFTPNGDGYNDTWKTKATEGTSDMTINIFDRFGRLLKTITHNDSQWDGTVGGQDLPSDDYWYVASGHNIPEIRGHFALKR